MSKFRTVISYLSGGNLVVTIPKALATSLGISRGELLIVKSDDTRLTYQKYDPKLVAQLNEEANDSRNDST